MRKDKNMNEMDIFITDLTPEAQRMVLDFLGLPSPEEGNYDVFPLFSLTNGDCCEELL
jgi:hypothetical protein